MEYKHIFKSLASFQKECPIIHKGTKGYGYTYTALPAFIPIIVPLLEKNGLGYFQSIIQIEGIEHLKTVVFHVESGETIDSVSKLNIETFKYEYVKKWDKNTKQYIEKYEVAGFEGMNLEQVKGSLITYERRYSLACLLGLVTDKDTDATKSYNTEKQEITNKEKLGSWIISLMEKELSESDKEIFDKAVTCYKSTKATEKHYTDYCNKLSKFKLN